MSQTDHLPSLVKLFDDESPSIRQAVLNKLLSFGDELTALLNDLEPPIPQERRGALSAALDEFRSASSCPDSVQSNVVFRPGQLVLHRRYGYRGVVVDFNLECKANDDWYLSNKTQPTKNQPWYHVLVHQSTATTYAAQTSLMGDDSIEAINHPWIEFFFEGFENGLYLRNDTPWPNET